MDANEEMDPSVVSVLVENHRRLLSFVERRVGSREVAEDILQDAFVRGLSRMEQLRHQQSVIAWFYRALRNALVDHWRHSRTEHQALEKLAANDDSDQVSDPDLLKVVCECATALLDTLKPQYSEILRRVELDGVAVKQFALENHISQNNASVRLFRAREALRRQVVNCCRACSEHGCLDCACRETA